MQIFNTITELQITLDAWRNNGEKIAFVPTMGGLHEGHLSLVRLAKQKADRVIVSIFVNPMQFAEHEDFGEYPCTLDSDLSLLETLQVDCVFIPDTEMIYPNGLDSTVDVGEIGQILCGKIRPHFFNGVVQVVQRLFDIVQPNMAVFGQKDYQQLSIIEQFTSGVEILSGVIVRENNGLAMSTRNQYLSADERKVSGQLHKILSQLQQGELDLEFAKNQLQQTFQLDYLEILDANTLKKITDNTSKIAILCAVFLGSTRLIDNIIFNK